MHMYVDMSYGMCICIKKYIKINKIMITSYSRALVSITKLTEYIKINNNNDHKLFYGINFIN